MAHRPITQEQYKMLENIQQMQLPASQNQIWAILLEENFNQERTIDRILNSNFAKEQSPYIPQTQ